MKKNIIKKNIRNANKTYALTVNPNCNQEYLVRKDGTPMKGGDWKFLRTILGVKTPFCTVEARWVWVRPCRREIRRKMKEGIVVKGVQKLERSYTLRYLDAVEVGERLRLEYVDWVDTFDD